MTNSTESAAPNKQIELPNETLARIGVRALKLFRQLVHVQQEAFPVENNDDQPPWQSILERLGAIEQSVQALRAAPASPQPDERPFEIDLEPEAAVPPAAGADSQLAGVVLGELASDPTMSAVSDKLLQQVLAGESAACQLSAFLLLFQRGATKDCHQWLKPIGEAWYHWAGQEQQAARGALIDWLNAECSRRNVPVSVNEVEEGVRFDSSRHLPAEQPGRDVCEVRGWLVLREDKSIYAKALVDSR